MKALAEGAGSVEQELMARIEELDTENKRLQRYESWVAETREQLAVAEQQLAGKEAELKLSEQENDRHKAKSSYRRA